MGQTNLDVFDLSGRTAVVTGAASGLGRAIVLGLGSRGVAVAAADVNVNGLDETVRAAEAAGGRALAVPCDVTRPSDVETLFDRCSGTLGPVDILVNDAFLLPPRMASEDYSLAAWDQTLRVNLTGYFLCAQSAGRRMIPRRRGSIINISSIHGSSGSNRKMIPYGVGKAAINQLTRELAVEWGHHGVRVNSILPCQMDTPALREVIEGAGEEGAAMMTTYLQGIPLGRLADPGDVVGAVVFLASDAARMVTGTMLPVDGGNLAMNAGASRNTDG
jgi:NAD(P)-dependent dehydrogenase (short-subunit alcohol dehydrogenase family)